MSTYSIYSRRKSGLDTRVWRVMFTVIILSIGLLGYKVMDRKECIPFRIDIGKKSHLADSFYFTGENVRFFASVSLDNLTWDFNDNSSSNAKGSFVTHVFAREGKYYVTASVNTGCEIGKWISVKTKPQSVLSDPTPIAKEIIGASATSAGKAEEYISPALADSFYEWVVLYHPEIATRYGEKAKFQFDNGGSYTIQLTLDHDRIKSFTKKVYVEGLSKQKGKMPEDIGLLIPKKVPEIPKKEDAATIQPQAKAEIPVTAPPVNKPKTISDELFKSYLDQVVNGQKGVPDFERYGIYGTTPVVANGKRDGKDFSWLCKEISGKKKTWALGKKKAITLESVQLQRINEVVNIISVNYHW